MDIYEDSRTSQFDTNQLSPKFGLSWNPVASTTIRVAGFRVLKQQLVIDETIQPTQVAGFNQFFDDFNGTDAYRYGAGLDQRFSTNILGGLELTKRDLTVPTQVLETNMFRFFSEDRDEQLHRAYLYWTPTARIALSWEYFFEKFTREQNSTALFENRPTEVRTHRLPLRFNYFHPQGIFTRWQLSYIDQDVEFPSAGGGSGQTRRSLLVAGCGVRFSITTPTRHCERGGKKHYRRRVLVSGH